MRTAIFCLESVIGPMTSPLAAVAQRPGVIAIIWEATGTRVRIRFDEACVDAATLEDWLQSAGYTVSVATLLAPEAAGRPVCQPAAHPKAPSIAWIEMEPER